MVRFWFMSRFRIRVSFKVKILFWIKDWVSVGLQSSLGSVLRSRLGSGFRLNLTKFRVRVMIKVRERVRIIVKVG